MEQVGRVIAILERAKPGELLGSVGRLDPILALGGEEVVSVASASTVTLTKTFTLKSNTTTTYSLPGKSTTLSDAGYTLSGPGF